MRPKFVFNVFLLLIIPFTQQNIVLTKFIDQHFEDANDELKSVHVIFRHGERTPVDTYPKDIHINDTFHPYGWGQLTNEGKMNMYQTGRYLRERYQHFLGDVYSPEISYAQSTWSDRAQVSCALVLAGLWPPKNTHLEWNTQLNWNPIPIKSEPLDEDTLLLARKNCPRYFEELENVQQLPEIQQLYSENIELFNNLTNLTGLDIRSPEDVQSLYSTLDAEFRFGLKLPEWIEDYFPKKMKDLTEKSYVINAYNGELKRLKGGPLLKKLISDWKSAVSNEMKPKDRKLFVYSGHDSTVANLLLALGVWERQIPSYGSMILMELLFDKIKKEHYIELFFRNSSTQIPYLIEIPGCDKKCPVLKLIDLTKNVVPMNWTEECKSKNPNYIPPRLREP